MKKTKTIIAVLALSVIATLGIVQHSAFADTTLTDEQLARRSTIAKKALLQGIYRCAAGQNSKNKTHFMDPVTIDGFRDGGYYNILKDGNDSSEYYLPTNKNGEYFSVFSAKNDKANCEKLLTGGDQWKKLPSAFEALGAKPPASTASSTEIHNWLTGKLGYFKTTASSTSGAGSAGSAGMAAGGSAIAATGGTQKCYTPVFVRTLYNSKTNAIESTEEVEVEPICVSYMNGAATGATIASDNNVEHYNERLGVVVQYLADSGKIEIGGKNTGFSSSGLFDPVYADIDGKSESEVKNNIESTIRSYSKLAWTEAKDCPSGMSSFNYCYDKNGTKVFGTVTSIYSKLVVSSDEEAEVQTTEAYTLSKAGWGGYEGYRVIAGLTGYDVKNEKAENKTKMAVATVPKVWLTNTERIQLYALYFDKMMGANVSCNLNDSEKNALQDLGPLKFIDGRTIKTDCYATVSRKSETGYHGVTESAFTGYYAFSKDKEETFDTLLEFFKNLDPNTPLDFDFESSSYINTHPTDTEGMQQAGDDAEQQREDAVERSCYDSAGSSNWIACPIIENGTSASQTMYEFIEGMLQVNTNLFNTEGKVNGTFDAWGSFRNIANILFIIVFIIVIISQVTGVGIDNYGIKKILPKLILGALLVNISFFVCQAAVDVANITGGGIKQLLDNITSGMSSNKQIQFAFNQAQGVQTATGVGAAALLAAIVGAAWYFSGGSILVPILLGVIAIIIGIVFLLILLAVRQGLAVILVAISPLAFIAYMLPNTKGLFNKWLKLLSGVLLAYPLCSLVVYGGQMVSTILLLAAGDGKVTNFALALTSAILSIAPVFFIPTLIGKSMSGISTVANGLKAKATGLGKSAFDRSHTADNIRSTAKARKDNLNVGRARRTKAAIEERRKANGGRLSIADRARLRTANNTIDAFDKGNESLYAGMVKDMELGSYGDIANGVAGAGLLGMADEAVNDHDMEKLRAVIERLNASGNEESAQEVLRRASNNVGSMSVGELEKFKNICAQSGGKLSKAYVKALASHMAANNGQRISFDTAMTGPDKAMASAIDKMGTGALADMNKDEMEFLTKNYAGQLDSLFSDDQVAAAAATHTSGKAGTNFANMVDAMSQAKRDNVKAKMSAEQWAKASQETLAKLGFDASLNDKMAQSVIASGDGDLMNSITGERQKAAIAEMRKQQAADQAKAEFKQQDSENRYRAQVENTLNNINEQLKNNKA